MTPMCVPVIVLSALHVCPAQSSLHIYGRCSSLYLTDGKTESQRGEVTFQGHIALEWQVWDNETRARVEELAVGSGAPSPETGGGAEERLESLYWMPSAFMVKMRQDRCEQKTW